MCAFAALGAVPGMSRVKLDWELPFPAFTEGRDTIVIDGICPIWAEVTGPPEPAETIKQVILLKLQSAVLKPKQANHLTSSSIL